MIMLRNLSMASLLVLVGCTTVDVPGHPEAVAAIQSYYAANAWEEGARCVSPSMTVTRTNVLEDTPERLVVEARYYWQDERRTSNNAAVTCSGFETRTFTLAQGRVVSMTGEQRR